MEIFVVFLLIFINGIFSMSEMALVSVNKIKLENDVKKGSKRAIAIANLIHSPNKFLSTVQVGITLIGILMGIYSGENIIQGLKVWFEGIEPLRPYAHTLAVTVVLISITFFSIIFGELIPKRIGLANPEAIAGVMVLPMGFLSKVSYPFVWILGTLTDVTIKVLRIKVSAQNKITEEEIKALVEEGTKSGEVQEIEQDIVERVFKMGDRRVRSLMTSRIDVIMLELSTPVEEVRKIVNSELHSVYPVYEQNPDDIRGVVYLKDLFLHLGSPDFVLAKHLQTPEYISENFPVYKALEIFKKNGNHFAVTVDEYGQMQGVITINDLLTALVGNVNEIYKEDYQIIKRDDNTFLIDGDYPIHDFLDYFEVDITEDHDFNTISGLLIQESENIPKTGEKIKWRDFEFEVLDTDGIRIDKVLIKRLVQETSGKPI